MAASSATSRNDSTLIRMPAATAWRNSARLLAGAGEADIARIAPASRATFSSPAEATSMPSTRPAMWPTSAGIGLAFIA
jgi:hypothetical protein